MIDDATVAERERALLGALLSDPGARCLVAGEITGHDFAFPKHQAIFDVIADLARAGVAVGPDALVRELDQRGALEAVGGAAAITALAQDRPQLRAALAAINEAKSAIPPIWLEPIVSTAARLLGAGVAAPERELEIRRAAAQGAPEVVRAETGGRLSSGFVALDTITGGLKAGNLIVVAAAPGMGATTFALNVVRHVLLGRLGVPGTGRGVALFSLDLTARQVADSVQRALARVEKPWIRARGVTAEEKARLDGAAEVLDASTGLFAHDTPWLDVDELCAQATKRRAAGTIDIVVADDLERLARRDAERERYDAASHVVDRLKTLAIELDVPVVLAAKLRREPIEDREGHRPEVGDLLHAEPITKLADVVLLVHQAGYYMTVEQAEETGQGGLAQILVVKTPCGTTGEVELRYDRGCGAFLPFGEAHHPPLPREQPLDMDESTDDAKSGLGRLICELVERDYVSIRRHYRELVERFSAAEIEGPAMALGATQLLAELSVATILDARVATDGDERGALEAHLDPLAAEWRREFGLSP
jgi:replicative DNA helicase